MTVSPATVRSPTVGGQRRRGAGTKTSIREPNFIRPMRWPVAQHVALLHPGDHPARDQADDLAEHHAAVLAVDGVADGDLAALVLGRALEPVGGVPLARAGR